MAIIDWVLVGAIIAFAWAGWRQGFVVGALSFAGFLGGGLAAVFLVPGVIEGVVPQGPMRAVVLAGTVLACALAGQVACSLAGRSLRSQMTWSPVQFVDNFAGAALNVLALAVITWILASALASLPATSEAVRSSRLVVALDSVVPDQVRNGFTRLRDTVGSTAAPQVFSALAEITGPDVPEVDPAAVRTRGVRRAMASVVRITGSAPDCSSSVSGSGFAVGRSLVVTNAHVVAGIDRPQVELPDGRVRAGRVMAFDPRLDVAVLRVPDLGVPTLDFSTSRPRTGDDAVVMGFPEGAGLVVAAARVRADFQARGDDIYGKAGVDREVISFRGSVQPGNSGGPLVSARGSVFGMVFGSGRTDPTTGYAIAVSDLLPIVDAGRRADEPVSTGSCQTRR
ncbi:MAG: MarP family serine protease [Actinomycetales bacterium]